MNKQLNQTESGGVKYWTSYNDRNHSNSHAEVDGIEFFAFPYQSYYARVDNTAVTIRDFFGIKDNITYTVWIANHMECLPDGRNKHIEQFSHENKDEVFIWAAQQLKENSNEKI